MCQVCDVFRLKLDKEHLSDKYALLDLIRAIRQEHPWHFAVGPMSDAERVWYDLEHPLRKINEQKDNRI